MTTQMPATNIVLVSCLLLVDMTKALKKKTALLADPSILKNSQFIIYHLQFP